MMKNIQVGFTLAEIMVVIFIMAILTIYAVPAFRSISADSLAANLAGRLADSLRLARAEAINSGQQIVVCPILPRTSTQSSACINSTVWDAWLVYRDKNRNSLADSEETIKYYEDIQINAITSDNANHVKYDGSGFCISGGHLFTIKPAGCSGKNARTVEIKPAGSIHVELAECK